MMVLLPGEQKAAGPTPLLLEGDGGGGAAEEPSPPMLSPQAMTGLTPSLGPSNLDT